MLSDGPATPMQHGRLLLAGDWLDPALPASLANAIASGHHAAQLAIGMLPKNNTPRQRERLLG